jgi:ABC-2 type transport system ATP-binding protein
MKLVVSNLEKSFKEKKVLKGASHTFEKGKIYGLIGRNGAGKTTMFNCLTGNAEADGGQALLQLGSGEIRPVSYDDIGYVFTQPQLPEFMTGYEFIKYFVSINRDKISTDVHIDEAFAMIDFSPEDRHKLIREYSHGMQSKLQMLAFLILRPSIILLDEPLTSLDVIAALQIKNIIKSIKDDLIIIFSTHILQLAQDLCDEIVVLHNGVLTEVDTAKLRDKSFEQEIVDLLRDEGKAEVQSIAQTDSRQDAQIEERQGTND